MTDKTLGAYQRHEKHDATDFANAEFARHRISNEVAAAGGNSVSAPWVCFGRTISDEGMAAGGWSPVRECPDPEQHRDPLDFQTSFPSPAKGMRYQRERNEARAMAALWKETARRAIQRQAFLDSAAAMEQQVAMSESLVAAEAIARVEKAEDTLSLVQQQRDAAIAECDKIRGERDGARARAEKAEREREEMRDAWEGAIEAVKEANALINSLRAAESRPLTPDAITDEMVERAWAWASQHELYGSGSVRILLEEALTEPPKRPEGAEEIDEHLRQANSAALGGALTPEQRRALADHLAGFGYRNPIGLAEDGAA